MKLKSTQETEIYISEGGYLTIRQKEWPEEDNVVMFSPEQATLIIAEMQRLLADPSWWNVEIEEKVN